MSTDAKKSILIVEDNKSIADLEMDFLGHAGFAVQLVPTAAYAVAFLQDKRYDAVILDYQLPGGGAWDVLAAAQARVPRVPVILATASGSETVAAEAIRRGASDYLVKSTSFWEQLPTAVHRVTKLAETEEALRRSEANLRSLVENAPDGFAVIRQGRIVYANAAMLKMLGYASAQGLIGQPAIETFIHVEERARATSRLQEAQTGKALKAEERRFLSKEGETVPTEVVGVSTFFEGGPAVAIFARDISDRKRLEQQLREKEEAILEAERQLARRDTLTGIANRRGSEDFFNKEGLRATRDEVPMALALLDVDHFKRVNDTHGHDTGDLVLKAVAEVLRTELRHGDLAGRWGGEEMIAVLPSTTREEAFAMAERLRAAVEKRVVQMAQIPVTASFGIGIYSVGDTLEGIVAKADKRLYEAKQGGRNCVR